MTGPATAESPLIGRRILLTRPKGRGESLVDRLESLGAEVEWRPAIAFEPPRDPGPQRRAVAGLAGYDWLLFTSANGVRHFGLALAAAGSDWSAFEGSIGVVGPATEDAVRRAGREVSVVAASSRAEGLAAALEGRVGRGERVLVVRPDVARTVLSEALAAAGAIVHSVAFYRTVAAPGIAAVASELESGRFDAVVLTSPSSLERLLETDAGSGRLLDAMRRTLLIAIGGVTSGAIERAGLSPAGVARSPTDEDLVRAIVDAFSSD